MGKKREYDLAINLRRRNPAAENQGEPMEREREFWSRKGSGANAHRLPFKKKRKENFLRDRRKGRHLPLFSGFFDGSAKKSGEKT